MNETRPGSAAAASGLPAHELRGGGAGGGGPRGERAFATAYPPRSESAAKVRRALRAYLTRRGVDPDVTGQVVLAADEAFVNAVSHARADRDVLVSARVSPHRIVVEVRDFGRGFRHRRSRARPVPRLDRANGRGLFLMRSMMDKVTLRSRRSGTTVRMVRRLDGSPLPFSGAT